MDYSEAIEDLDNILDYLAVLDARRDLEQLLINRLLDSEPNTEDFR